MMAWQGNFARTSEAAKVQLNVIREIETATTVRATGSALMAHHTDLLCFLCIDGVKRELFV